MSVFLVPAPEDRCGRRIGGTSPAVDGGTEQDVADILGISPAIVRKHYAKWSPARQERITKLMESIHSRTILVQTGSDAIN